MSSPEHTMVTDDTRSVGSKVPRRRRSRVVGVLLAVTALALVASACSPKTVAEAAISKHWGSDGACASRIVKRESNYQSDAVNPYSGTTGLFQMHPVHKGWIKAEFGYNFSDMKDPFKNAKAARRLFTKSKSAYGDGWQPWRLSGRAIRGGGCPA